MAFDGIVIANIVSETSALLTGGRIARIAQPEADELLLTVHNGKATYRLFLSASPSLPLIYLTDKNLPSPAAAPSFCMLLRKHIGNGRIRRISQPGLERIVRIEIEHLDELGDLRTKVLIAEFMGKHSNLIFCDENETILDSIKRIPAHISSVREVLPGRPYFIPNVQEKADLLTASEETVERRLLDAPAPLGKSLYQCFSGISPVVAEELCERARILSDQPFSLADGEARERLLETLSGLKEDLSAGRFSPAIYRRGGEPVEFSSFDLTIYRSLERQAYDSVSALLQDYYAQKNERIRIRQKSHDLARVTETALERAARKLDLQERQLKDTEKRDRLRTCGELLRTYAWQIEAGAGSVTLTDYATGEPVKITLDPTLNVQENANRYFDRYQKLRRTAEALSGQVAETRETVRYLTSVKTALSFAADENDLAQIRQELAESGFLKKQASKGSKKRPAGAVPLHYISSDGFDIYVGKNNYQNEALTFGLAAANDWWFHAKGAAGSHVIVRTGGKELPDRTFEEAAALAAWYSSVRDSEKAEVDYTLRRNLKKPAGANPGFVIYHTNYSMIISPEISGIRRAES